MRFLIPLLFLMIACSKGRQTLPRPDGCAVVPCHPDQEIQGLRFFRGADSTNLLFGAGKSFNADSLQFYSITNSDTNFVSYTVDALSTNQTDSVINLDIRTLPEALFLRLNAIDTDTINFIYSRVRQTECCPAYDTVIRVLLNLRIEVEPGPTVTLYK